MPTPITNSIQFLQNDPSNPALSQAKETLVNDFLNVNVSNIADRHDQIIKDINAYQALIGKNSEQTRNLQILQLYINDLSIADSTPDIDLFNNIPQIYVEAINIANNLPGASVALPPVDAINFYKPRIEELQKLQWNMISHQNTLNQYIEFAITQAQQPPPHNFSGLLETIPDDIDRLEKDLLKVRTMVKLLPGNNSYVFEDDKQNPLCNIYGSLEHLRGLTTQMGEMKFNIADWQTTRDNINKSSTFSQLGIIVHDYETRAHIPPLTQDPSIIKVSSPWIIAPP